MKIALAQLNMEFENKPKAMQVCTQMMADAHRQNADLIVFPEMTLTGFTMKPEQYGEHAENSETISFFQKQAIKNHIAVVFGVIFLEDGKARNHSIVMDHTGIVLANYAKIHPFSYGAEAKHYVAGDTLVNCKVCGATLAPFVCYDLRFPEIFQAASKKSQIMTVIANWPVARVGHWITLLQARAIENQSFVVGVNRSGKDATLTYTGDSMLVSPTGAVLAHLTKENELAVVEIDLQEVADYRDTFPLKADRKEELYCRLFAKD